MMPVNYRLLGEHFFVVDATDQHETLYEAAAADLHQQEQLHSFLEAYGRSIKAVDLDVPAAYLSSYYSGMLISLLYSLSCWNRSLSLEPDRLTIKVIQVGEYSQIRTVVEAFQGVEGPAEPIERERWVQEQLTTLISGTLRPLVDAAATAAGLNPGFLWGQMPTRVGFYVERLLSDPNHSSVSERLGSDYAALQALDPAVFGSTRNPMVVKPRYIDDYREEGKQMKMKNVCCLYHKTEGGQYCYTCPKLKGHERAEKCEELRQQYAAAAH
ncbi:(2Fe-2S)-binding protein [Paenibacillus sp. 1P07SE]|uniref:(2Fe-2S)-binding protein n=1 Tax=Paenibacillus sp. 1P07SE TaxID=3132209 RepID=UPI0039A4DA3D